MVENADNGKRTCSSGNGFTDSLWGEKARVLVGSTQQLEEANWDQIEAHASVHFQGVDHDDEEDGEDVGAGIEVYAQIEID